MGKIIIKPFLKSDKRYIEQAQKLLECCFPQAYSNCSEDEMKSIMEEEKIVYMAAENGILLGFAGAMPQYGITGWELHPLVVINNARGKGVGRKLVHAIEQSAAKKGCITMYLGSDDEFGKTSLSNTDLYEDTLKKIENIKNIDNHTYEFYMRMGYKIVGVIPDANGIGKPDIIVTCHGASPGVSCA